MTRYMKKRQVYRHFRHNLCVSKSPDRTLPLSSLLRFPFQLDEFGFLRWNAPRHDPPLESAKTLFDGCSNRGYDQPKQCTIIYKGNPWKLPHIFFIWSRMIHVKIAAKLVVLHKKSFDQNQEQMMWLKGWNSHLFLTESWPYQWVYWSASQTCLYQPLRLECCLLIAIVLLGQTAKTSNRNIAKEEMQIHKGVKEFRDFFTIFEVTRTNFTISGPSGAHSFGNQSEKKACIFMRSRDCTTKSLKQLASNMVGQWDLHIYIYVYIYLYFLCYNLISHTIYIYPYNLNTTPFNIQKPFYSSSTLR